VLVVGATVVAVEVVVDVVLDATAFADFDETGAVVVVDFFVLVEADVTVEADEEVELV
jgi:hypothetical protein